LNKPIPESYSHRKFKNNDDLDQTVLMSLAVEDMKQNPDQYKKALWTGRKKKFSYHIRHGHVSPPKRNEHQSMINLS